MDALLVDVDQTSFLLKLGRSKTYELILSGQLASLKIGRSRRVPMAAIEEFIQAQLESPTIAE